jgi:kinesin family protein 11
VAGRVPQVIKCDEANREVTLTQHQGGKQLGRTYHFDKVFGPDTTQERLYETAVAPIVDEVLQGFNCTIFAYGQTGTGKTHTMTGDLGAASAVGPGAGVVPRAVRQIFAHLDAIGASSEFTVKCCFLELYNEEITDLLAMGSEPPKVRILEDRSGVVLQGLEEPHVKTSADIFGLLETGNARRRTAETLLNKQSSRSHSVFVVTVSVREVLAEGEEVIRVGKLYLVDLAGSENVSRSGAVEARAKEAGNINKSLLTLGRVITALVEGQGHVPYRDSKLTRLLRDSLGGRTKTCIIATIAPTVQCQEETTSTLDYAHRAKNIKNKPEVNQKISKTTHLKEAAGEIARLKAELVAAREKHGVYLPAAQYEEDCAARAAMAARVAELEEAAAGAQGRLEAERAEGRALRRALAEREHVLAAHAAAEAALAEHAGGLTDGLAAAAADVAQLFRRVDAHEGADAANLALLGALREAVSGRAGALEAALAGAAAAQAGRFAEAAAALEALAGRKRVEETALAQQMGALRARVQAVGAAAEAAAAALGGAGRAALEVAGGAQAEFLAAAQAAAGEAAEELAGAHAALAASMEGERSALEALLSGQAAATEAMRGAAASVVAAVRQALEAAREQAEAAAAEAEERLARQAAAAAALEEDFAAAAAREQAALVEQVAALVGGFVASAGARVQGAVEGIKIQLAADQEALAGRMGALARHAGASLEALDAGGLAAGEAAEAAAAALAASGGALGEAVEASAGAGAAMQGAAAGAAAAAAKALQAHSKAAAAAAKKGAKSLAAAEAEEAQRCAAATAEAEDAQQAAQEDVLASLAADQEAAATLLAGTAAGQRGVAALAEEQAAGLCEVAERVRCAVDDEFRADAGREAVPARGARAAPPRAAVDALRAPPAEQLLEDFRAGLSSDSGSDVGSAERAAPGARLASASPADENNDPLPHGAPPRLDAGVDCATAAALLPRAWRYPCLTPRHRVYPPSAAGKPAAAAPLAPPPAAVLSPATTGQKRGRASDSPPPPEQSPSKLRHVFQRSERARRVTRSALE